MTLDGQTDNAPPDDSGQNLDQMPPRKQRRPGVISLRVVILLLFLLAASLALSVLRGLSEGGIDLLDLLMLALALVASVGLLARTEFGRKAGIGVLWIAFAWNAIGLLYYLVIALGVAAGTIPEPDRGSISASIGFQVLHIAVGIWMLTVLHSSKTVALMETSTPPISDGQEDHARASAHA